MLVLDIKLPITYVKALVKYFIIQSSDRHCKIEHVSLPGTNLTFKSMQESEGNHFFLLTAETTFPKC